MKLLLKISVFLSIFMGLWVFFGGTSTTNAVCLFNMGVNCNEGKIPYDPCPDGKCIESGVWNIGGILKVAGIRTDETASQYAIRVVKYFLGFVTIIAVIYIIWAGFQLMIGAGDEEKAKKAKNIIVYVIVGIVIMWLAYSIVTVIMNSVIKPAAFLNWMPEVSAANYTENDNNTFNEYKKKLQAIGEQLETELRVNGKISSSLIWDARNLINEGYNTLPDDPESSVKNDSLKRGIDLYLQLAEKNPGSTRDVANLISGISTFISSAQIEKISGQIDASPVEGNAPLTVTFRATNVKDPSWVVPSRDNFIWWTRINGGVRKELGRGPTFTYTFSDEQTYTVFLDIVSGSRNKKWRIDVLPFSDSKQIEVKPRIGNITMFINGVNVSDLSTFKINPAMAKAGLMIDATASRGTNGTVIQKTTWDFGNENQISYAGAPQLERQVFANDGKYTLSLELINNQDQTFKKTLTLLVVDPTSVIQIEKDHGFIGETFRFSALSYFSQGSNIVYRWEILDQSNNSKILSSDGNSTSFVFQKVGRYTVTLHAKNPNGKEDIDSREISIESKDPVPNLEVTNKNGETPNLYVFDASRSFDADTSKSTGLTYTWRVDGSVVDLENSQKNGAIGTYTFTSLGEHAVNLTIANAFGKVTTTEIKVVVTSLLSVHLDIDPMVARIGDVINLSADSPNAYFYEWSFSDGTPSILWSAKAVQHVFKQSWSYTVNLTVKSTDDKQSNQITRRMYATDATHPFALIEAKDWVNVIEDTPKACDENDAFVIDRTQNITIDGSNSINIDGTKSGLSYTWKYQGKNMTSTSLNQKFDELGCFPIELIVKSEKNGTTSSMKKFISVQNLAPKLTSITATRDNNTKVNGQKVLINVSANAARDDDGVIVSYLWYYYTDSDPEPQNIRITQSPNTIFVVPNITEKYYFGVILEDNDGAKMNSKDRGTEVIPLLVSNDDGNVNIPLISLTTGNSTVNVWESTTFSASTKTILGKDITGNSEYYWDFNGDGIIDKKGTESRVSYTYTSAGTMNMKVKVVYNGVSNTKYQTMYVKNELSPNVSVFRKGSTIFAINTSLWVFEKAHWTFGDHTSDTLYSASYDFWSDPLPASGKLEVTDADGNMKDIEFPIASLSSLPTVKDGVEVISIPELIDDTITVKNKSDRVALWLFTNEATRYVIDEDSLIDSDLNGVGDDDADNKNTDSYTKGSPYILTSLGDANTRERNMKVSIYDGQTLRGSHIIHLILDYIAPSSNEAMSGSSLSTKTLSAGDQDSMDALSSKIRGLTSDDRAVLMQKYNILLENWEDPTEKTKMLIDIQEYVDASALSSTDKSDFSKLLNSLLIGDGKQSDDISIATQVVKNLIPSTNPNSAKIQANLDLIGSHPSNLTENKKLGTEILELIKDDTTIEDKYKLMIKEQLKIIVNGWQTAPATETGAVVVESPATSSTVVTFIKGFVKIFLIIIGVLIFVLFCWFLWYTLSKRKNNIGFQDFIIDSIFHGWAKEKVIEPTPVKINSSPIISPSYQHEDPLKTMMPEREEIQIVPPINSWTHYDPLAEIPHTSISEEVPAPQESSSVPDWLKVSTLPSDQISTPVVEEPTPLTPVIADNSLVIPIPETTLPETVSNDFIEMPAHEMNDTQSAMIGTDTSPDLISMNQAALHTTETIPEWLKPTVSTNTLVSEPSVNQEEEDPLQIPDSWTNPDALAPSTETIPEWLRGNDTPSLALESWSADALFWNSDVVSMTWDTAGWDTLQNETPLAKEAKLPDWLTTSAETITATTPVAPVSQAPIRSKKSTKKTSETKNPTPSIPDDSRKGLPSWLQ